MLVRERRIAKARRVFGLDGQQQDRGYQVDQAAAEDHRTTDASNVLQLLRHPDDAAARETLQRLHVKLYHCETARLQNLFRAVGAPARACNSVPQVVQASQVCRPWKKPGQSNKLTYSLAMTFNEEVQFDLMFYHGALEPGLRGAHGIPIVHLIDCCIRWSARIRSQFGTTRDLSECISLAWVNIRHHIRRHG